MMACMHEMNFVCPTSIRSFVIMQIILHLLTNLQIYTLQTKYQLVNKGGFSVSTNVMLCMDYVQLTLSKNRKFLQFFIWPENYCKYWLIRNLDRWMNVCCLIMSWYSNQKDQSQASTNSLNKTESFIRIFLNELIDSNLNLK